ncbi:SDR family oxidoreductase [Parasphingorhabdus sp.]|uniref:SDR family oxidoreductase n=1 Tax=Parasphingorhabdus sp. TaxID=2709688 RepID=UPI003BB134B3
MSSPFDLTGKTALVTGGAQGLGRMIAEGLANAGARVAITSRSKEKSAAAAKEISDSEMCVGLGADLSTPKAAVDLANEFREVLGDELHVLVNNAGQSWGADVDDFPDEAWDDVLAVNLQMPFTLVREFLPELEKAGQEEDPARILNIGSIAGATALRLRAYSYSASKAAIHQITRDLAGDLAKRNITANAILPGFFPTGMTAHLRDAEEQVNPRLLAKIPMKRMGKPDEIAALSVFLSCRASAYITGTAIPIDGGIVGCG